MVPRRGTRAFWLNGFGEIGASVVHDDAILYVAESEFGQELWRTDGSEAGTFLIKDIKVGPEGSEIREFFKAADYVYFTADDGV